MANSTLKAAFQSLRPPFLLLAPVCVFLGIALAYQANPGMDFALIWSIIIGALAAHGAVNCLNEYLDFKSGLDALTDKTPFSGGSGALISAPEAAGTVFNLTIICLLITVGCGLYLVYLTGPELVVVGLVGILIILAYTRIINRLPVICLLTPGFAFGPLMVGGTYWVLTGELAYSLLWASLPVFFMVNNLLLINQLPDVEADRQVGRRTFPIAFGSHLAVNLYFVFSFLTLLAGICLCRSFSLGAWSIALLIPFMLPFFSWAGIRRNADNTEGMLPFMGLNVAANLIIPLVTGSVILLG